LLALLSIVTGRLGSSVDDRYQVLNHLTQQDLTTIDLPTYAEPAKKYLVETFPELAFATVCNKELDKWLAFDKTPDKSQALLMWEAELKMLCPAIKDSYMVAPMKRGGL
jgi:predicted RNase H-like nuclease